MIIQRALQQPHTHGLHKQWALFGAMRLKRFTHALRDDLVNAVIGKCGVEHALGKLIKACVMHGLRKTVFGHLRPMRTLSQRAI